MTATLGSWASSLRRFEVMAFSGNGPVEEWIEVRREEWERKMKAGMVMCWRNDRDDTDGETLMQETGTSCETRDVTLLSWRNNKITAPSRANRASSPPFKSRAEALSMTFLCVLSFQALRGSLTITGVLKFEAEWLYNVMSLTRFTFCRRFGCCKNVWLVFKCLFSGTDPI